MLNKATWEIMEEMKKIRLRRESPHANGGKKVRTGKDNIPKIPPGPHPLPEGLTVEGDDIYLKDKDYPLPEDYPENYPLPLPICGPGR